MNVSAPFIRRPIATSLLMVGLLLSGILAFFNLPVAALPQVEVPTLVVATQLPGASAQTMSESVTTPLERQLGQVPSVTAMTSVSSEGMSQITLSFALDRNLDAAVQDVQSAINAASSLLPPTLPAPPTYSKQNPADAPVMTLAVRSAVLPLTAVNDYADSVLAQRIAQISGVGLVSLGGSQKPAVRVRVDPLALGGRGMTLEDVRLALVAANVNQPKGSLEGARRSYTLETNDQLQGASAYRDVIIAYKNGAPVRLQDVAEVNDGVENAKLAAWANDARAVMLSVQRQPGANVLEVADRVRELIQSSKAALPNGIEVEVLSDRTESVRASVEDVEFTLVLTVLLVVAVMYLFLRSVRATLIPGVAVPLSLVGTFGVMHLLGYSLNNLSLMALTIATGFVVDDAIVMVENVARHLEHGKKPLDAAIDGAKQIGFTIVSLTVSLVAVLIPLLFMEGIVGRLFREFAVTLATAIVLSAFLSLSLTAMMCAHVLRPEPPLAEQAAVHRWLERMFEAMVAVYDRGLVWVLAHRRVTLLSFGATLGFTVLLALWIPKGFFPEEDTGLLLGTTRAAPDVSFARMTELQQRVADVVRADADVEHVASTIGADGKNPTTNSGSLTIVLRPHGERGASASEIRARLLPQLAPIEGIGVALQSVQDLQVDAQQGQGQYHYVLQDANAEELFEWAPRVLERFARIPAIRNVRVDGLSRVRSVALQIDRDMAARLGVSIQTIDDTLYDAFGQRQITTLFTQKNLYRVILEVPGSEQRDPRQLESLFVRGSAGASFPLSTFVAPVDATAPLTVMHDGQFPAITVSFDSAPGASLGDAVTAIHAASDELGLPMGLRGAFHGTAQVFSESLEAEPFLVLAALITVYLVLGVLYESLVHPITILSTLPSAGVGALLALLLAGMEFSIMALIGILLLIGIVKKNAIMMIDFALEAEREQGLSPLEAIHQACLLRFRPIMMTTIAALLGGLPLALGSGLGSELRRPLGISIVGGLLLSQLLTLYTTPVIYLALGDLAARLRGKPRATGEPAVEVS